MLHTLISLGFVLLLICAGMVALFLWNFYDKKFIRALIFKAAASVCFVTWGAVNCFLGDVTTTNLLIFIGLCFGIVGDEVIALCQVFPKHDTRAFIGGGSFFLVGHLLYILALLLLCEISWISAIISFAVMVVISLIYENSRKFLRGNMKIPLALYLGIVTFMGAIAIGVFIKRLTIGTGLFALGGMLFTLSDNILFAYKLGEKPKFIQNILLHVAYYLAQLLIAWSIVWI